jgi:hypothetical protein
MKQLTVEEVSPKAVRSAQLWLMGYLPTAEWQDPDDEYDNEYDEWNYSDGWDLNLYQCRNTVTVCAYPFVDGETDTDRWVVVAEGTVEAKDDALINAYKDLASQILGGK